MHTHFPRLPGLVLPIVFFPQFVSIHLHFYAKLVVREFYYRHENIKKAINHNVTQVEPERHTCPARTGGPWCLSLTLGRTGTWTWGGHIQTCPLQQDGYSHGFKMFFKTCHDFFFSLSFYILSFFLFLTFFFGGSKWICLVFFPNK